VPIFLLFISYLILEAYVFVQVWDHFGLVNTLFVLFVSAIFGIGLIRNQGRYVLQKMQASLARGLTPEDQVLHSIFIFAAGVLFIVPGFISDVIGLLLLLPGSRHAFVAFFKRKLKQKMGSGGVGRQFGGNFRVFTFGNVNNIRPDEPAVFDANRTTSDEWARDVSPKVIDVTPIANANSRTSSRASSTSGEDSDEN
jgi:UPF0716 protein FxsA